MSRDACRLLTRNYVLKKKKKLFLYYLQGDMLGFPNIVAITCLEIDGMRTVFDEGISRDLRSGSSLNLCSDFT